MKKGCRVLLAAKIIREIKFKPYLAITDITGILE
jgi:hypothetical protein